MSEGPKPLVTAVEAEGWRRMIVLTAAVSVLAMAAQLLIEARATGGPGGEATVSGYLATLPAVVALVLVALGGLALFRRTGRLVGAVVAMGAMVAMGRAYAAVHGTSGTGFVQPGAALLGWIWGAAVVRADGRRLDPALPALFALACFAATYTVSGISKLLASGWDWTHADHIRLVILTTAWQPMSSGGWNAALQSALVDSPVWAHRVAVGALVLELSAPLALLGRRPRTVVLAAILSMHLGIALLMEHIFFPAMLLCLVMASPRVARAMARGFRASPSPPPSPQATAPSRRRLRLASLALGPIALLALPALVGFEPRIDAVGHVATPARDGAGRRVAAVGPLREGQQVWERWTIDGLHRTDATLEVTMAAPGQPPVSMHFCRGSEACQGGAYDRPGLSIRYTAPPTLDWDEVVAPVCDHLMALLEAAAGGDLAQGFDRWLDR
ncbi:MAG: hypothetical protein H6744_09610 [Deltaproteobacteria bacterium]|nr:hypothetical protein [Deltaproteobacteria bacterium]